MKRLIVSCFLVVFAVSAHAQSASEQVKNAFETYKQVISSGQGQKALLLIDDNTAGYYNDMLTLALTANRQTLEKTTLTDQMTVLFLRHKVPAEKLRTMDGRELFVYSVNQKNDRF
ncbi:MAG: hypothetical protein WBB45_00185 [Cyclobacteriaceae bacterium]